MTCEPERCHDAGPRSCCTTLLNVCAGFFPSFTSEHCNRIFHLPSVLVDKIPYAPYLQCQSFATFSFVVLVEGRQECSSSSPDIHPFLECFIHSYICVWPRELSPNASLSILCVSKAILLSFTSVILAVQYNRKTALAHHKNAQKKHALPHSRMPLGRVVHKGSSLWYLAVHNCTTSSFHVAFQFQGLLSSTSYLTTCNVILCLVDWQWNRWCSADSQWDCQKRDNAWKPSERASDKIPEE